MESRVTITRDGEVHVTVTGVNEIVPASATVTNLQPIEGTARTVTEALAAQGVTRRKYNRKKKISRKNRRK